MDLLDRVAEILAKSGYDVFSFSAKNGRLSFEDDSLLGHVVVYETVDIMLSRWMEDQSTFLTKYAASIRSAGEKSWNVYQVFLCQEGPSNIQTGQIQQIEDDLRATRKIAGAGIDSTESLVKAMLPLLPLQYQIRVGAFDVESELREILGLNNSALDALFSDASPMDLLRAVATRQ